MNCIRAGLCALVFFAVAGCTRPEYLTENDLKEFVRDQENGLSKTIEPEGYTITATFRPNDLMVAQELRAANQLSPEVIQSARAKHQDHYYFILSISKDGKEVLDPAQQGLAGFSELVQTLSFQMSDKVVMTTPIDTIPVADYIFNRTFGLSPSTDLLFVFSKEKALGQQYVELSLEEFGLGIGRKSMRFDVTLLENAPKIYKAGI